MIAFALFSVKRYSHRFFYTIAIDVDVKSAWFSAAVKVHIVNSLEINEQNVLYLTGPTL